MVSPSEVRAVPREEIDNRSGARLDARGVIHSIIHELSFHQARRDSHRRENSVFTKSSHFTFRPRSPARWQEKALQTGEIVHVSIDGQVVNAGQKSLI
ncbi:hypothetical protein [Pseudooceanicola sp.]|uniref:hypothetical protein n=1 Tax=Pseudooceanicola sp. TaxID=1914328 RepID=UPI0035112754